MYRLATNRTKTELEKRYVSLLRFKQKPCVWTGRRHAVCYLRTSAQRGVTVQ